MSTRRRIEFELVGSAGNIEQVLNRLNNGIVQVGRSGRGVNRELGMIDRQLLAIGTTARYALAGSFIFGITGALSRLNEFNNQLGTMASLMGSIDQAGNYRGPSETFLGRVGDEAQLAANRVGVATEDIQNYMTRFGSAFDIDRMGGRARLTAMRGFVDEVARLQAMLGSEAGDPQQLAGGIAGMVRQIDPNNRNIAGTTNRVANLIGELLRTTPNITGRDVSRDIGRVGATMNIANMSPEQAFAVWAVAGRAGGSSSVIGRGVSQLLGTSLLHPQSPEQKAAFASIGLSTDPTTLRQMGGMQVLMRMAKATGVDRARFGRGTQQMLAGAGDFENLGDDEAVSRLQGLGINLTLLYNLMGRQESVRQFVNLLGQGGVRALRDYIKEQQRATAVNRVRQREEAAIDQRQLARFNTARQNISLSLVRGVAWPLENVVAPAGTAASNQMIHHPRVTQALEAGLLSYMAGRGVMSILGRFRGRRGGVGAGATLASGAIMAEELPGVLGGGRTDGTRERPFWVIISPFSRAVGGIPEGGAGGGSEMGGAKDAVRKWAPWIAAAGARFAPVAGAGAGAGALGALGVLGAAAYYGQRTGPRHAQFEQALDVKGISRLDPGGINRLAGEMDVTVRMVDAQGRTITTEKKKGVPAKFSLGQPKAPTSQGKTGSRRGRHR